jgi:hypothetical protein
MVGHSIDNVASTLADAQQSDDLNDWFFYGAAMGNVAMGVASVVTGALGVARLATAGAGELSALLRARISEVAPDVRGNPFLAERSLSTGSPVRVGSSGSGNVIRNALQAHEAAFAQEIVDFRGGTLTGGKRSLPGIDGTLDGTPISLKETEGKLIAVLRHASTAEAQAAKAGYSGVDVYIKASKVEAASMLDFAKRGPLSAIPEQGVVSNIYILTKNGWVKVGK